MSSCSSTPLYDYKTSCKDTTWLYNNSDQWTLIPGAYSTYASHAFYVSSNGGIIMGGVYDDYVVRPVTYLKSNIKIIDGVGTEGQPFKLSLN